MSNLTWLSHSLLAGFGLAVLSSLTPSTAGAEEPHLAHMVYFKLKDRSDVNKAKLVAACKTYLSGHQGTVYFAVGTLAQDFNREVNDRDFDVSLHLVFASKADHDRYQSHPRHEQFISNYREMWEKVRVFDSYLSAPGDTSQAARP